MSDSTIFVPTLILGGGGEATTNDPPTAEFTFATVDLTVEFTDASTDTDGTISSWSWAFGDGTTSAVQDPSHTYAAAGTYTVILAVNDDEGATDSVSQDVTVSSGSSDEFSLSVSAYKVRGAGYADLTWSGATSTNVDIYRDGSRLFTVLDNGTYTDDSLGKGGGTATYQVCEEGTRTCSNSVTVSW